MSNRWIPKIIEMTQLRFQKQLQRWYHYDNTGTTRPLEKSVRRDWKALENHRSVGQFTNVFQPKKNSRSEVSCSGRRLSISNCSFTALNVLHNFLLQSPTFCIEITSNERHFKGDLFNINFGTSCNFPSLRWWIQYFIQRFIVWVPRLMFLTAGRNKKTWQIYSGDHARQLKITTMNFNSVRFILFIDYYKFCKWRRLY